MIKFSNLKLFYLLVDKACSPINNYKRGKDYPRHFDRKVKFLRI